jgi:hypothetical protein
MDHCLKIAEKVTTITHFHLRNFRSITRLHNQPNRPVCAKSEPRLQRDGITLRGESSNPGVATSQWSGESQLYTTHIWSTMCLFLRCFVSKEDNRAVVFLNLNEFDDSTVTFRQRAFRRQLLFHGN